ncbi:MAG: hypothetical protein ACRC8S_05705 [Fimbriiglobus sp.]
MRIGLLILVLVLLVGANSRTPTLAQTLSEAEAALARDDDFTATELYLVALRQSPDPGSIAYNLGVLAARQGDARNAELWFTRCLDDAAIPASRAAKAWYNRGVVLLKIGRRSEVFAAAIESFEQTLANHSCTGPMRSDAAHNLELAKRLWLAARALEKTEPPKPPERKPKPTPPPPEPQERPAPSMPPQTSTGDTQANGSTAANPGNEGNANANPRPGTGPQPVLQDTPGTPKSPEEARAALLKIAERLQKSRRMNAELLVGPERPNVPDW